MTGFDFTDLNKTMNTMLRYSHCSSPRNPTGLISKSHPMTVDTLSILPYVIYSMDHCLVVSFLSKYVKKYLKDVK